MYGEILRAAKVVKSDLTDAEKAKLDKFRHLLSTTKRSRTSSPTRSRKSRTTGPC